MRDFGCGGVDGVADGGGREEEEGEEEEGEEWVHCRGLGVGELGRGREGEG